MDVVRAVEIPAVADVVADVAAVYFKAERRVEMRLGVAVGDVNDVFGGFAAIRFDQEVVGAVRKPEVDFARVVGEEVVDAVGGREGAVGLGLDPGDSRVRREAADVDAPDARGAVRGLGQDGAGAGVVDGAADDGHGAAGAALSVPDVGDGVRTGRVDCVGPRLDRAARDADRAAAPAVAAADRGRVGLRGGENLAAGDVDRRHGTLAAAADAGAELSAGGRHDAALDRDGAAVAKVSATDAGRIVHGSRGHGAALDRDAAAGCMVGPVSAATADAGAGTFAAGRGHDAV